MPEGNKRTTVMKNISFIRKSELGDDSLSHIIESTLNVRFCGFLCALARKRDINLPALFEDAASILEDAEISQPSDLWWRQLGDRISALILANDKVSKSPCDYNVKLLQEEITKFSNWYLFE